MVLNRRMREAGHAISLIRSVLRNDWDPIGVSEESPDEYESYVMRLYTAAAMARDLQVLCAELAMIELNEMCLNPTMRLFNRRHEVAQKILDSAFME